MLQMPITPQCSVSVPPYRWRTVGLGLRLAKLFNRRCEAWGWRDRVENSPTALEAFEDGRIAMRLSRLPPAAVIVAQKARISRHGNESDAHARMKLAALLWMEAEGATDAQPEARGVVGIADAYSLKANWIVECGNTRFGKLAEAVTWEDAPRFTLIPYQAAEFADGSPRRLLAIDFTWDKSLTDDIEAKRWAALKRRAHGLDLGSTALAPSLSGRT